MEVKRIIIKFVIILLLSISIGAIGILFKDVTIKDTYSYNSRFVTTLDEGSLEIIVDTETNVMYLWKEGLYKGGLTIMLDTEGKPLLWKE